MSLKEQINSDINVFLNIDEFAEKLTFNGVSVSVVRDNDRLMQKQQIGQVEGDILIFAAVSNFETAPNIGNAVKLNDRKATITDIKEDDGIYEITLIESRR